jgi:hypothetical protein
VVGHPGSKYTQLPARDGVASGTIKRSNKFPNCSYFTNWTSLGDTISWDVEVAATGTFDVEIYYACPKKDVGSTIELSLKSNNPRVSTMSVVRGQISEAHDPPLRGAREDRVKRRESYVKTFKPLKLGPLELTEGTGKLVLQALKKPGSQVMEVRLIMFTRRSE